MSAAKRRIRAIGDAAARWIDADFPPRVRVSSSVVRRTGYSLPVVEYALDRLFESITQDSLAATIADELGSLDILDGFTPRSGRTIAWAAPLGKVCLISSRTTVGVALPAAIFALCAGCDVVVKDREDSLVAAFFNTLHEEHSAFEKTAHAQPWTSNDEARPNLASFDAVVVFGRNETLQAVRDSMRPDARCIGFGPRASAGYVTRADLENESAARKIAEAAARDIVLYETEGCLSLHIVFAERGGRVAPEDFETILQSAIAAASIEFPPGTAANGALARIVQAQAAGAFRSAVAGSGSLVQPPALLPRVPAFVPVDNSIEALEYLQRHGLALEGFALAADRDDVRELAVKAGAVRLARFGELQNPPLAGNHGGRSRISDFVKWIDKTL